MPPRRVPTVRGRPRTALRFASACRSRPHPSARVAARRRAWTMRWHRQKAVLCIVAASSIGALAQQDEAWRRNVADTISATCAIRGLDLKAPLRVLPMDAFQGGYTPGIGSVTWEADHARMWREGWCALGVYCARDIASGGGGTSKRGFARPAGLYDPERNVLFVRDFTDATAAATIAHEAVHALQHQHFPALRAIHLWRNRDLAAAANSAIEGDAHVVGWSFDPARRTMLCSMDPERATSSHAKWWEWQPDGLSALEAFPHVFGTEPALREVLAHGQNGMDRVLREPPLSTLAVLRPSLADTAIDFVRLPEQLPLDRCTPGLRNTAGVVGIWGLLRQHGDAEATAESLPALLEAWRGDRFVHLSCPGDRDDELAWVTRWQSPGAAAAFAARYGAIADGLPSYGGLLGSVPTPTVAGRTVTVVTAGLRDAVTRIAGAEIKAFARFTEWVDADCFPDRTCEDATADDQPGNDFLCTPLADRPDQLDAWLARIRRARSAPTEPETALPALLTDVAELAAFCARNGARNADFLTACRAVYTGARYVAQLNQDPNYRLLPFCLTEPGMRDWVRATYYADDARPYSAAASFTRIYGIARASIAFATAGFAGLHDLTAAPPLTTLALLQPGRDDVALIGLPRGDVKARGCEVSASHTQGALAIWRLVLDHERREADGALPDFLGDWKGDRLFQVRCPDARDWIWISLWRTTAAAAKFAARYRGLSAAALAESELPDVTPTVEKRSVWIVPPSLEHLEPVLTRGIEVREFDNFADWVASGCFPQKACR